MKTIFLFWHMGAKALMVVSSIIVFASCGMQREEWQNYAAPDGSFNIKMPMSAERHNDVAKTPFGNQVVHTISWKPGAFANNRPRLMQVTYTDCPKSAVKNAAALSAMLDSSINSRKADFTESEVTTMQIVINGKEGREFICNTSRGTVAVVKECIVNGKLFDLVVVSPHDNTPAEDIRSFFDSFDFSHADTPGSALVKD